MMQLPKILRSVPWLIGTLVLGALGNGVWEIAKPALIWISSATLDVATLGLSSLRDGLYEEIARGTYERAGEKVLTILLSLGTGLPLGILVGTSTLRRLRISRSIPTSRSTPASVVAQSPHAEATQEIPSNLSRNSLRRWVAFSIAASFSIALLVSNVRMIYIIRAANHMEQLQRVVAPFILEQQRLVFASRFAAMHTRDEYVALIAELTSIASKNSLHIPVFDVY